MAIGADSSLYGRHCAVSVRRLCPLCVFSVRPQATALLKFIGVIKVVPFFGGSFTSVFPWFIFVIALCTLLNVWGVLARMLNIQRFQYVARAQPGNERHQDMRDSIAEGKKLIELSIRNEQRMKEQMAINDHNRADSVMLV